MKAPFVRAPGNYDMDVVSQQTALWCLDGSLTQQQFRDECDINNIVDQFMKTGVMPDSVRMPQFVDYTGVFDFQSAQNAIRQADESFASMPARVRSRFHNSPQEFLEFFADPSNGPEAVALGLAELRPNPKPAEKPVDIPAVSALNTVAP